MVLIGLGMLVWSYRRPTAPSAVADNSSDDVVPTETPNLLWRRLLFTVILLFSLSIPSDRTQDIPNVYGKRHPGLEHSLLYPRVSIRDQSAP